MVQFSLWIQHSPDPHILPNNKVLFHTLPRFKLVIIGTICHMVSSQPVPEVMLSCMSRYPFKARTNLGILRTMREGTTSTGLQNFALGTARYGVEKALPVPPHTSSINNATIKGKKRVVRWKKSFNLPLICKILFVRPAKCSTERTGARSRSRTSCLCRGWPLVLSEEDVIFPTSRLNPTPSWIYA